MGVWLVSLMWTLLLVVLSSCSISWSCPVSMIVSVLGRSLQKMVMVMLP